MFNVNFCNGIHGTGWFVQNDKPGLADENLGKRNAVAFPFRELAGHPFKDLLTFFFSESCHFERYKCLSHCELFWKLQADRIGKVVNDRAMGKKIIFLVKESYVWRRSSP